MFDEFEDDDDLDIADDGDAPIVAGITTPREAMATLGHEEIEQALLTAFNDDRLPHALIFAGPAGIGKATFAFRIARFLLTRDPVVDAGPGLFGDAPAPVDAKSFDVPSDHPAVTKIVSGAHPNLLFIERVFDEKKGKRQAEVIIDEARRVAPFMRMTAADGGWRVVIIDDADTLNRQAQNALLKILEEPPPQTLLILIAHNIGRLLPTIRSRCRMVTFPEPSAENFADLLRRAGVHAEGQIELLRVLTGGSVGRAIALTQAGGLETLAKLLTLFEPTPRFDWPEVHALAEQAGRYGDDEAWSTCETIVRWIMDALVRSKATGQGLPPPLDASVAARMIRENSLPALLALRDRVTQLFDSIDHSNLDRRQAVLGLFTALGNINEP